MKIFLPRNASTVHAARDLESLDGRERETGTKEIGSDRF